MNIRLMIGPIAIAVGLYYACGCVITAQASATTTKTLHQEQSSETVQTQTVTEDTNADRTSSVVDMPEMDLLSCEGITPATRNAFQAVLEDYRSSDHEVACSIVDLDTGVMYSYQSVRLFYSASSIKAPYIISALQNGAEPDEHMQEALKKSSNKDYAWCVNTYGWEPFEKYAKSAGVDIQPAGKYYAFLTSSDLAKLWIPIYPELTFSKDALWIQQYLDIGYRSAIKEALGQSYQTFSKAGWIKAKESKATYASAYTCGGIVMAEHPYIISLESDCQGMDGYPLAVSLVQVLHQMHEEICIHNQTAQQAKIK